VSAVKGRGILLPGVFALGALIVLVSLGTWQLERKAWKEALIATLNDRVHAAPIALPPPGEWSKLTPNDEFTRVRLRAKLEPPDKDALVYAANSALRDDVKAPGYFVFAPARLPDGSRVAINRGYVLDKVYPIPFGSQEIVGYLRWPEGSSLFVADHDQAGGVWYVRDHRLMAKVRGWGEVAPFYIEQESPVPPSGLPHPASLKPQLRNDHLQYAITWYGLALTLVGVFAFWVRSRFKEKADAA
jgi:cytochrome oxidase assembly protein ShyY1